MGDLLAGFLVLYTCLTSNSVIIKEKENNIIDKNNDLYINEPSKKINRCTLILIVSIIEFIIRSANPVLNLIYIRLDIGEFIWLFFFTILSRIFFSYYLLKINLYRHHFFSLIIFLIGNLLMCILAYIAVDVKLENWPYFSFVIITNILNGLEDVLNKLLLTDKYMLPHILIFFRGLYNFGMAIIFLIILKFSGIEFTFSINLYNCLFFIFIMIAWFIYNFFSMEIIYIFTPQHITFLDIVYFMLILIFYRISNNYSKVIIVCEIIIFLFMIFSSLLFSEMIIINKWGLNENTKRGYLIKEKQEFDDGDRVTELIDDKEDKYDKNEEK